MLRAQSKLTWAHFKDLCVAHAMAPVGFDGDGRVVVNERIPPDRRSSDID